MGRKLNLCHLSEAECEHILEVVHKDFSLRYMEKERLRQIEEDVQEEETKYTVLSKSLSFNDNNCICCFSRFLILFNPRIQCDFCKFKVCKNCIEVDQATKKRCCQACLKYRQFKKQSNDWFYSSVEKRFKRCGSAKVIRSLYKRRLVEGGAATPNCFSLMTGLECDCEVSPCHIHRAIPSAENDDKIHSTDEERRIKTILKGHSDSGSSDEFQEVGTTSIGSSAAYDNHSYPFQTRSNRPMTPLRADSSIQTEWVEMADAETMTMSEETSRCFRGGFDGMATVSTEGREVDPQFITRPHNVRVLEGEPLKVECKVNGTEPMDVLWFCTRNQVQQLQESERCEMRRHDNAFSLTLYEMHPQDSLEYMCIAVNALGQCAQGFTVTVEENEHKLKSPEFVDLSDIEIVPEGSNAALRCRVSAYPEPKITWYKNNRQLVLQGGRYRMERHQPEVLHYILIVEEVKGDDSGTYSIVARNPAGEARHAIQLLVQPNVSESTQLHSTVSPSCLSASHIGSSEDDIMRLAEEVSRTQGRYRTTASRMLRSANAMSSMQSQLDEMDRALEGLEGEVLEVISDEDDDEEDDVNNNNNCRMLDDLTDMESSAEAVGMVTSAALQLLSSARQLALNTLKDGEKEQEQDKDREEEDEQQRDSDEEDEDDEEEDDCVDAENLCLSFQELEKLFQVGLLTRTQLKNRLVQKREIKYIRSYLQSAVSGTLNDTSSVASGNQSDESIFTDAMDTSVDSIDSRNENAHGGSGKNKNKKCRQEKQDDALKGQMMEPDAGHENLLTKAEQRIYMTSGKVFSLEDYIRDLEQRVLEVDETTSTENLATLENSVARAVARVTKSDHEVNEIERQIERWMTNKNIKGCSNSSSSSQHQKLTSSRNQRH